MFTRIQAGLGGEVMPGKTLDAYAAVTKSDGNPGSGVQIGLLYVVEPENRDPLRADYIGSVSPNGGSTGADGRLNFTFTAPSAPPSNSTHTIAASCPSCSNLLAEGTVTVPGCPVDPLKEIDKLSEEYKETPEQTDLTQRLEDGMNGYNLLSAETQAAEQCLKGRINTVVVPESGCKVTSTIRTFAYQAHLRNVWEKFWELKRKVKKDPTLQQRCQTLITKVEGEMGFHLTQNPTKKGEWCNPALGRHHCIITQPAGTDPKHTRNIAFDISRAAVTNFNTVLTCNAWPGTTVQQEANTCGLNWGGTYGDYDPVHFVLQ